ncbi:hypothetical protein PMAYCL1PPCAC_05957, partial [Pristionchus mayeri]
NIPSDCWIINFASTGIPFNTLMDCVPLFHFSCHCLLFSRYDRCPVHTLRNLNFLLVRQDSLHYAIDDVLRIEIGQDGKFALHSSEHSSVNDIGTYESCLNKIC